MSAAQRKEQTNEITQTIKIQQSLNSEENYIVNATYTKEAVSIESSDQKNGPVNIFLFDFKGCTNIQMSRSRIWQTIEGMNQSACS